MSKCLSHCKEQGFLDCQTATLKVGDVINIFQDFGCPLNRNEEVTRIHKKRTNEGHFLFDTSQRHDWPLLRGIKIVKTVPRKPLKIKDLLE